MKPLRALFERTAESYLPYIGHIRPDVVLLNDGSVLGMAEVNGQAHELASPTERDINGHILNETWKNIASDTITASTYFVRREQINTQAVNRFDNRFAENFDKAFCDRVLGEGLLVNQWFTSCIVAPPNPLGGTDIGRELNKRISWLRKNNTSLRERSTAELQGAMSTIRKSLGTGRVRRLGLRQQGNVVFSEIAEILRLILTCKLNPCPLTNGPLGQSIYIDRVVFGHYLRNVVMRELERGGILYERSCPGWAYEIQTPGKPIYGAILGLRDYMPRTWAGIFDPILTLPFPVVASQHLSFLARGTAIGKLDLKANQMKAAGDKAASQVNDLAEAQNQLMNGDFSLGAHSFQLAILSDNLRDLEERVGLARSELADAGAVIVPETLGMEAAYFAQLPGNMQWRTRPAVISTRHFARIGDMAGFPRGSLEDHWGSALMRFKTAAKTTYDYTPHVSDVGQTLVLGRITSGKTTFLLADLTMSTKYMVDRDAIAIFHDKDRGGEIAIRALGGNYLIVRGGESSGLAPLLGFDNTSYARDCLARWVRALIESDGHGPLPPSDDERIARGIRAIMRLPPKLRSLLGLRQFLGWRDPMGAGARIERWCRGGIDGWMFDGDQDIVNFNSKIIGIDFTAILNTPLYCEPAAQYLRDRIRPIIDGRRAIIIYDEAWAYVLSEKFEAEIKDFLLTIRKQNGIVILATQQPEDLLRGTFGPALIGQCHTMVFFPTPDADEDIYRGKKDEYGMRHGGLGLTEGEFRAIKERMLPGSRNIMIKRRGETAESVIVDFDLSALPEYVAVLSGRATTVRFAEKLREQNPEGWLDEYMARYKEVIE